MQELVTFMARALVDEPDAVEVSQREEDNTLILELAVAKSDLGKVIGKQGRTARTMRSLLSAAGSKIDRQTRLDILE